MHAQANLGWYIVIIKMSRYLHTQANTRYFWEIIFVQPFSNNFLTTFYLILTLSSYFLSFFFSLHYFWPIKWEEIKVVPKSCTYITTRTNKYYPTKKIIFLILFLPNTTCSITSLHQTFLFFFPDLISLPSSVFLF